tara:strand:+ start:305 stop:1057 length:753 start_codon:yes stop_codon:yes gene_type:complete
MKFWLQIIAVLILVSMWSKPLLADDTNTQTNTSGSNTNITGGYEATTTNNNDGQTNTTTSTSTTTNSTNGAGIPPPSANSPSFSSMSQDVCSMGVSGSISSGIIGFSGGKHVVDENCERIKLAKVLQDFGMKVASVAVLCQDKRVHAAMESAGTPCPYQGLIGPQAQEMWNKYPEMRPDYKEWLAKNKIIAKVDERIAEENRIEAERIAAELAKAAEEEALKQAKLLEEANEEINAIIVVVDTVPINRSD